MNALGVALVGCVIQVTLFALAVGVIYTVACRRDPERAVRTVLGGLVGVALLTVVCWSPWPSWSGTLARAARSVEAEHRGESRTSKSPAGEPASPERASPGARPASELSLTSSTIGSLWEGMRQVWSGEIAPKRAEHWTWLEIVAAAFVAAAALGMVRLAIGLVSVTRLARGGTLVDDPCLLELVDTLRAELGCTRGITLVECTSLATAATVGWRHAWILLPSSWRQWSTVELRAVLAHEIAHVGRGDFGAHLVAQVGLAFHSYHPLVHWLVGRLRLEQELAADAAAARVAGGRQSYLTTLAGLALVQPAARVAWPAQAFIPSRHMFLRRIEMLCDQKAVGTGSGAANLRERIVGWLAVAGLCGVGFAVIGLRAPVSARAENQVATAKDAENTETPAAAKRKKTEYDFSYVPENTMALFAVRPAELAADPRLRPLAELLEVTTRPTLPSELLEQSTLLIVAPELDEKGQVRVGSGGEQIVIHATEPVDFEAHLRKWYTNLREVPDGGFKILASDANAGAMSFYMPDSKTLLGRGRSGLAQLLVNRNAALPPKNAEKWQAEGNGPFFVVVQSKAIGSQFAGLTSLLGPLLKGSDTLTVSVEPQDEMRIVGRLTCKTPDDAKRATDTLNALIVIAQNAVDAQRERVVPSSADAAATAIAVKLADHCLATRKITTSGSTVQIEATLGKTGDTVKMIVETLAPAVRAARAASERSVSTNNLKQIALAMHLYADKEKHFPPAVLIGPDGKTPYSWRVALLPHLGQDALYKQYRFDQPWDSAENRKVLEQVPTVYRHPLDDSGPFNTSYFVFTGPDTAFPDEPAKGTGIAEIRDGTSRTILAVEAKRHTPWTKPEDIAYTADGPVPKLGGFSDGAFNAALCDGSVRLIANAIDEKLLRAMITKAGGERFDDPTLR